MKTLNLGLAIIMTACLSLLASSCTKDVSEKTKPQKKVQLTSPYLRVTDITENSFTIQWDAIEHASTYSVSMDNEPEKQITETTVTYSGLAIGKYTVRVKAVPDNKASNTKATDDTEDIIYLESEIAEITVEITGKDKKLETPSLKIKEKTADSFTIQWEAVEHASQYSTVLNDDPQLMTEKTEIKYTDLKPGTYTVKVKALTEDEGYLESDTAEIEVKLTDSDEEMTVRAEGYYAGDYYGSGNGNGWINFIYGDITTDAYGNLTGEGKIICIDMNIPLAENPDYPTLGEGEYTAADNTNAVNTINLDGSSYIKSSVTEDNGEFTDAQMTVQCIDKANNKYKLEGTFKVGDKSFSLKYEGAVRLINHSEEGQQSNLTSDINLDSKLNQGYQLYMGDIIGTGESEVYVLILADDEYNIDDMFGLGQNLMLYLTAPLNSASGIPEGKYSGMIDMNTATSAEPNSCLGGLYYFGEYMGCWYFHTEEQYEASFKDGEINVSKNGEKYTISGFGTDGYGHKIEFNYEGEMPLYEVSMAPKKCVGIKK